MSRFERWAVWSTSIATFVTGVVYLWLKYLLTSDDPFAVVNHPWQPWVLKLHILVAPLLVFSIGLVAVRHVWRHLQSGAPQGRRSGLLTLAMLVPMVATGYLIQAVTAEGWLRAMAWSHIGLGLVYGAALLAHQFAMGGREARAARVEARRARARARGRHPRRGRRRERAAQPERREESAR
jgi:hypothetical protein